MNLLSVFPIIFSLQGVWVDSTRASCQKFFVDAPSVKANARFSPEEILRQRLPLERNQERHDGTIGDNVVYIANDRVRNGNVPKLVMKDPRLDPHLYAFIEKVKTETDGIDGGKVVFTVAEMVLKAFSKKDLLGLKNRKYKQLHGKKFARLGDFIKLGKGVCQERALLVQIVFEELGIESRMALGTRHTHSEITNETTSVPHLWNEVRLTTRGGDKRWFLFDLTMGKDKAYGLIQSIEPGTSYSVPAPRLVTYRYENQEDGFWYHRTIPLDHSSIPHILEAM